MQEPLLMSMTLVNAECLEHLKTLEDGIFDSLVTDPPAGISFMGKGWDSNKGGRTQWIKWMTEVSKEMLRVLKPGAHGLVWALPRTSHWTALALEKAGFEVRDCITHVFGSGFPKSLDISKAIDKAAGFERDVVGQRIVPDQRGGQINSEATFKNGGVKTREIPITAPATPEARLWQGWGTALKPASEHWWLVRKPLAEKTVARNVLKYGTGGINIDASRIELDGSEDTSSMQRCQTQGDGSTVTLNVPGHTQPTYNPQGRFPANLIVDETAVEELDRQSGVSISRPDYRSETNEAADASASMGKGFKRKPHLISDTGGASRFFYVAKASKRDKGADNKHPTVKNTKFNGVPHNHDHSSRWHGA